MFFGGGSVWNLIAAAAFMGASSFFFLSIGAKGEKIDPRVVTAADTVVAVSSFAVYAAMIACAESVLKDLLGVRGLSVVLTVLCAFLSAKNVNGIARLNLVAVPALIALVIFVGAKTPFSDWQGEIRPFRAVAYGAMNMFFSGALMIEQGKTLSKKERLLAASLCGGLIFLALLFMFRAIGGAPYPEMPFLRAAESSKLGAVVPVCLLLAVITTMAGCDYLVAGKLTALTKDPVLSGASVALAGILLSCVGFAPIVRAAYPVVSYLGSIFALVAPIYLRFVQQKRGKC